MRVGYLQCVGGVSGDMLLGAIVDAGVPLDELRSRLGGWRSAASPSQPAGTGVPASRAPSCRWNRGRLQGSPP